MHLNYKDLNIINVTQQIFAKPSKKSILCITQFDLKIIRPVARIIINNASINWQVHIQL